MLVIRKITLLLIVLMLITSVLLSLTPQPAQAFTWPWQNTDCSIVIDEDAVYVDNDIVYMRAEPHTLNDSGWVEFRFMAKNYTGALDVVYGFNGIDGVQAVNPKVWESYEHTYYEAIDGDKWEEEVDELTGETYLVKEKVKTELKSTYPDWNKINKTIKHTDYNHKEAKKWQSVELNNSVTSGELYVVKCYIDIPLKLGKVNGKYVIGLKPSHLTIEEAESQGSLYLIDPWYSTNYLYRKQHTINNAGANLTNYQIELDINQGAGVDAGTSIYLNSHSLNWPYDIRFAQSNGSTLIDFWREEHDGTDSIHWVEYPTINTGNNNYYIYYGNAAGTDASNGTNTFELYQDLEEGSDGNNLGGDWTFVHAEAEYSNTHSIGDDGKHYGTLSGRFLDDGAADGSARLDNLMTLVTDMSIRYRMYKDDASELWYKAGDDAGDEQIFIMIDDLENIKYYDGGIIDTGQNCAVGSWFTMEYRDLQWDAVGNTGTYDIYYNGAKIQDDATTHNSATRQNDMEFYERDGNASSWIDNIIVRNLRESNQPTITTWGAEENAPPPTIPWVVTDLCSGFSETTALINGEVVSYNATSTIVERGFDYGTTIAYGNSQTTTGTFGTGVFLEHLSGLSPATLYHYRAKALDAENNWGYGEDRVFVTKGSPVLYEYFTTTGTADSSAIYGSEWGYQTFTTNTTTIPHTVTSIWLYLRRVNSPGTITASIKHASGTCNTGNSTILCGCYPTGDDLVYGSINGNSMASNATYIWQEFEMSEEICLSANTTYAIVVRALNGDNTNYINWRQVAAGGYDDGNAGTSSDSGSTWSNSCPADNLFQVWGNPCLEVLDAKVFSSYVEDDDWLVTCLYKNIFPPYYTNGSDVADFFYLQLVNSSNSVKAQTKVKEWGYRPGSIYINASGATSLEWGHAYTVRMQGDFVPYPYMEYQLQPDDWMGDDLTRLDSWVRGTVGLMEEYDGEIYTVFIAGKGVVLDEDGGVIFTNNIDALDDVRPNIFQITQVEPGFVEGEYTQAHQDDLAWQVLLGPKLATAFTTGGNVFNVEGSTFGMMLCFVLYIGIVVVAFPMGHSIAAILLPAPIIYTIWGTGLAELVTMGVFMSLAVILLIWQVWLKGA